MMLRWLLRAWLVLMIVFIGAIVFVLALPYDDSPIDDFMLSDDTCHGKCVMGIYPGQTTVHDTLLLLRGHDWVSEAFERASGNGYAQITWDWSGAQPAMIDSNRRGRITMYWDDDSSISLNDTRIETIVIHTHVRIYDLEQWLGDTTTGMATVRSGGEIGYSVVYPMRGGLMNLTTEISCPFNLMDYWQANTRITMSIGRVHTPYVSLLDRETLC